MLKSKHLKELQKMLTRLKYVKISNFSGNFKVAHTLETRSRQNFYNERSLQISETKITIFFKLLHFSINRYNTLIYSFKFLVLSERCECHKSNITRLTLCFYASKLRNHLVQYTNDYYMCRELLHNSLHRYCSV